MTLEQALPQADAFEAPAIGVERTYDPGVHAELVLELPGRPAGMADIGAQLAGGIPGERHGLLLPQAEARLGGQAGSELPRAEGQPVRGDGSALEKRDVRQRRRSGGGAELPQRSAERTVDDHPEGALRRGMQVQQHDGLAEMDVAQLRMRDEQLSGQAARGRGHQRPSRVTRTPACPNISATSGSFL